MYDKSEYKLICETLWGGSPVDKDWAVGTKLYQNARRCLLLSGSIPRHIDVPGLHEIIQKYSNVKLIVLREEYPWKGEIELVSDSEFGLNITILNKERNVGGEIHPSRIEVFHNCTELHHKYDSGVRTAFESDIHSTGCTKDIKHIDWIRVDMAEEISKTF